MTGVEAEALAALYDTLGVVVRQLEQAGAGLGVLTGPVNLADVPAIVADATDHVARAYRAAAEARKAYA